MGKSKREFLKNMKYEKILLDSVDVEKLFESFKEHTDINPERKTFEISRKYTKNDRPYLYFY